MDQHGCLTMSALYGKLDLQLRDEVSKISTSENSEFEPTPMPTEEQWEKFNEFLAEHADDLTNGRLGGEWYQVIEILDITLPETE
jgi:hypothetical protein